jgi:hypothetical protein
LRRGLAWAQPWRPGSTQPVGRRANPPARSWR